MAKLSRLAEVATSDKSDDYITSAYIILDCSMDEHEVKCLSGFP
jgi:hypothetical protein